MPFDLLLGRPWQRGNLVSIDEWIEGTFLVFKDLHNTGINYELLVEQDIPKPEYGFDVSMTEETTGNMNYTITPMQEEVQGHIAVVTLSEAENDRQTDENNRELISIEVTYHPSDVNNHLSEDMNPSFGYLRSLTCDWPWSQIPR